jgi:hypothetical protein
VCEPSSDTKFDDLKDTPETLLARLKLETFMLGFPNRDETYKERVRTDLQLLLKKFADGKSLDLVRPRSFWKLHRLAFPSAVQIIPPI